MNDNAKKWVQALRSGDWNQTTNTLRRHTEGPSTYTGPGEPVGYCCLGVACEMFRQEHPEKLTRVNRPDGETTYLSTDKNGTLDDSGYSGLPKMVREWLGMYGAIGVFEEAINGHCSLAQMNDFGLPFGKIANCIESEPPGLFTT